MLVALTLDDNWDERTVDILDETQVVATLFPSGRNFQRFSASLTARCARHEIGNHTFDHVRLTEVSNKRGRQQIDLANRIIEEKLGVVPQVFAYPYGLFDPRVCALVASFGFAGARSCEIKGDIRDKWRLPAHAWIEQTDITKQTCPDPYLIIGVHPFNCSRRKMRKSILWLQEKGAEFVTLSDLIRVGNMV